MRLEGPIRPEMWSCERGEVKGEEACCCLLAVEGDARSEPNLLELVLVTE